MPVTGDHQLLKQLNRMALVRQVSTQPGLSRASLAEVLGLTKSTVSMLVRDLMDEGWLTESELIATGEVGRLAHGEAAGAAGRAVFGMVHGSSPQG